MVKHIQTIRTTDVRQNLKKWNLSKKFDNTSYLGVFRALLNIYDGTFLSA